MAAGTDAEWRRGADVAQVMAHVLKENSFFSGEETLESMSEEQLRRLLFQVRLTAMQDDPVFSEKTVSWCCVPGVVHRHRSPLPRPHSPFPAPATRSDPRPRLCCG